MKYILAVSLALFVGSATFAAETWGPTTGHRMYNLRAYTDGRLVFQFTPALDAGCQYNDHAVTPPTAPSYKLLSALAISAFNTDSNFVIIHDGCASNGGVNVTGLIVNK